MATGNGGALLKLSGLRDPYPGASGVVQAGALADLLLVEGNPLEDLIALTGQNNLKIIMKDGYYDDTEQGKVIWPKLKELYFKADVDAGIDDQEIKDRVLFSNVIEALRCLQEGALRTVVDGVLALFLALVRRPGRAVIFSL